MTPRDRNETSISHEPEPPDDRTNADAMRSLDRALEKVRRAEARLEKARRLDPKSLVTPFTI